MPVESEAVVHIAPVNDLAGSVLPDNRLHGLPVTSVGSRDVGEFRQGEHLAVNGVDVTDEGAVEDGLLRDGDGDQAGPLAVEVLILEDERIPVGIKQFHTADEFQVRTEDGELLSAVDLIAVLLGAAGDDGVSDGQRYAGFDFFFIRADLDGTAFGLDAGRGVHADHVIADMLEAGDADPVREHDLLHVLEPGAVDGHRLSGDDLRGEERLDVQSDIGRFVFFLGSTCRQRDKGHGHQYA